MTKEELLCQQIEALCLPIEPLVDTSADREYVVYTCDRSAALWGDDEPCIEQQNWKVIYVAPLTCDRRAVRQSVMQAIFSVFGAWPTEDDYSDENGQRWVYEFETIGGIEDGQNRS